MFSMMLEENWPGQRQVVGQNGWTLEVCMIGVCRETPNGFHWKINCGQKSPVSIKKSPCIIKVSAGGNRYKLHLSSCPGAPCLIKRMGFSSVRPEGVEIAERTNGEVRGVEGRRKGLCVFETLAWIHNNTT